MEKILGVDEAGRGPLIGPLVVCGFIVETSQEEKKLSGLGVDDSKKIPPPKRESLCRELIAFKHQTILIQPAEIDKQNINFLELTSVVALVKLYQPYTLIWDAPVAPRGLRALKNQLIYALTQAQAQLPRRLIVENKADANYPACMAASIVAKVTRDKEIQKLKECFGDLGSGYPSDPKTRCFVSRLTPAQRQAMEPHIRKKWATLKKLVRIK